MYLQLADSPLILFSTSRVELQILLLQPEPHWGKFWCRGARFRSWTSIYLWNVNYSIHIEVVFMKNICTICTVYWWFYWMQMDSQKCVTCNLQLLNANALKSSPIPSHSSFSSKFSYPGGHLDCHYWRSRPFVLPSSASTFKDQKESCIHTSNPHSLLSYLSPWTVEH